MNNESTDFIKSVNNSNKINEIELFTKYKSSYKSALIDLSIHISLFSLSIYSLWLFKNSWLSCFTIPILGLLLSRNYVVFHDCLHNSYTPNYTLNYILASCFGITTFTSANWILDHHTHHLTNGNIENEYKFKFNELLYYKVNQYKQFTNLGKIVFEFFHTPIIFFSFFPFLYFGLIQRFIYFIKKIKYNEKIKSSMRQILINHLINNIGLFFLLLCMYKNNILFHYLFSSYISFIINFLLFFNQHTFNPPYVVGNKEWTQRNSGLLGSSFVQIPKYLKYFMMGIEYHHIHHTNSKIPGYNLQKYHEEVVLQSNIYDNIVKLSMGDCFNNLWLVLYDEDKHKYITLKEINEEIKNNKNN
jgi:omega-6 fatty acid desaturase (delta-12 desaturase)